jgi:hypothetical protein
MSVRVRHVDKSLFKNYLRKSEECFNTALEAVRDAERFFSWAKEFLSK